jgi:Uroporphyrinogen decarboxylase (URO-D)
MGMTMNNRDRFRAVLRFERVDRLPRYEWATWWDQTVSRWQGEGVPASLPPGEAGVVALMEHFGLDPVWQAWHPIARTGYPELAHGEGPVGGLADYEAVRPLLYPEPEWDRQFPPGILERHRRGEVALWYTLNGFFWFPRQLLGIQRHLLAFYDQPELLRRIADDLLAYNLHLVDALAELAEPEFMTIAEDMSYNGGPMLSESHFDEFMAPYCRELTDRIRRRDTVVFVDSDGDVEWCVPWFARCGVQGMLPLERQSGVDVSRLRERQCDLRMIGGFDKMTMTRGAEAIRAEFERLLPTVRQGGFIPSVDHQTPPGVSPRQYRDYLALLWEYSEKGAS